MTRVLDFKPDRGCYRPGAPVQLDLIVTIDEPESATCRVMHLASEVAVLTAQATPGGEEQTLAFRWTPPPVAARGYGADVELRDAAGRVVAAVSTAFDVLDSWTDHPRYGFLSEFGPHRDDIAQTIDALTGFHINGLQFYDWQYRHDDPLPPGELFEDPLGRPMSRATIVDLAQEARRRGMAPMAYLAVYGASAVLWRERPEWALYDEEGAAVAFGKDFLGLMDPTRGSGWAQHLHRRCDDVMSRMPFDGIHLDQYGEPRSGYDRSGNPVDLPAAFADFVTDLKERHPQAPATFNAVKNWPIDELLPAPMDFVYIELWPDTPSYAELASIVADAHAASGGKHVVIALYLPADRPLNVVSADAVIAANGGSRIEIGEGERLLTDPYFPLHQNIPPDLRQTLRRHHDFRVRYGELLGLRSAPVDLDRDVPDGVWATMRAAGEWLAVNLVNMSGIEDATWDDEHPAPDRVTPLRVSVAVEGPVAEVMWASPDGENIALQPAEWLVEEGAVRVMMPRLDHWALLAIRTAGAHW